MTPQIEEIMELADLALIASLKNDPTAEHTLKLVDWILQENK